MSASRFVIGVACGGVGSFYVLREITERRLVTWKRPDAGLSESFIYHRRLRRMVMDELQPNKEDELSQAVRRINNSAVHYLAGKPQPDDLTLEEAASTITKAIKSSLW